MNRTERICVWSADIIPLLAALFSLILRFEAFYDSPFRIYNILIQSKYSMVGAFLSIATCVPFMVWRIKNKK
jgi:hypothetical protein